MTSADMSLLRPKVRALAEMLIGACKKEGFDVIVSRGFRSTEEQDALYELGRTKPGNIVTNARGGSSYHNYGVAFDVRPVVSDAEKAEYYARIGPIGEKLGLEWGGRWTEFLDPPHYQYTAGYSIDDFKNGSVDESKFL